MALGAVDVPRCVSELDQYFESVRPELRLTREAKTARNFVVRGIGRWPHEITAYGLLVAAAQGALPGWAGANCIFLAAPAVDRLAVRPAARTVGPHFGGWSLAAGGSGPGPPVAHHWSRPRRIAHHFAEYGDRHGLVFVGGRGSRRRSERRETSRAFFAPGALFSDPVNAPTTDLAAIEEMTNASFPDWHQQIAWVHGDQTGGAFEWTGTGRWAGPCPSRSTGAPSSTSTTTVWSPVGATTST